MNFYGFSKQCGMIVEHAEGTRAREKRQRLREKIAGRIERKNRNARDGGRVKLRRRFIA
jgi:hypothetical protein